MNADTSKKHCTAVVLSAGSGSRMGSDVPKQYMPLGGKPVIWHSLNVIERSEIIDDCVLVVGERDIAYAENEIVQKYGFTKVVNVIAGGTQRCFSVMNAISLIVDGNAAIPDGDGYIFIHDGARPFLTEEILRRLYETVRAHRACVAAMPSKDTVKIADEQGFALSTPDRRTVWSIQTPQVFETRLIAEAYGKLGEYLRNSDQNGIAVTDDAGAVELFTDCKVKMAEGSYENIKLTTPEDFLIAESFLASARLEG